DPARENVTPNLRLQRLASRCRACCSASGWAFNPAAQVTHLPPRNHPESSFGKALGYLRGLWPGLSRFLDEARIPLDNNRTERGLRAVVLGRKNHYGSRSRRDLEVAALF